jgi:hypothetical protein
LPVTGLDRQHLAVSKIGGMPTIVLLRVARTSFRPSAEGTGGFESSLKEPRYLDSDELSGS